MPHLFVKLKLERLTMQSVGESVKEKSSPCRQCKLAQWLWKPAWQCFKILIMYSLFDLIIHSFFMDENWKHIFVQASTIAIAALFGTVKSCKPCKDLQAVNGWTRGSIFIQWNSIQQF